MIQEELRKRIRIREFKQSEIGKILKLTKGTVSKKANGNLEFSIEEAEKIFNSYGYNIIIEKKGEIEKLKEELKEYKEICNNKVAECLSKFI